ncbi:IPT/TIG domain-containing protein [Granulicella sp. L56]|uniref:IPT/TIG domain-containing protein n=1 Tax=Granulicella sp. L56 TaxID=1747222 RepID=UPI00131A7CCC|nr:IPT/TIG domain-containing protein [Granulicella sp. L56]MDW5265877.1 IPT/TIG domain-containing protein [Edaphobacter sp.]
MPGVWELRKVLFVSLFFSALIGCSGPQFQGSLSNRDGNGGGPIAPAGQPQVTSVSPATAVAGGGSFTLTVTGLNFAPTTAVLWDDNTSLTTTYVSPTVLRALVPASLIGRPDTVTITPSPLVSINYSANFTVTSAPLTGNPSLSAAMVPVQANDIAWNPANQQFYLSVASGNGSNANTITALDAQTGGLGASVSTGSQPDTLAISTDGTYLYAGLNDAGSVHRYTLPALQSDIDIPLGSETDGSYYAIDVAVLPGSPHSVAISRGIQSVNPHEQGGVLVYDDAVARAQSVPGYTFGKGPIDSLLWNPNGQGLYGIDTELGSGLYVMSVNPAGVQLQTQISAVGSALGNHLHFDSTTGYIYTDSGKVIDPATNSIVGTFPLTAVQGVFNGSTIMVPDGKLNIAYFLGQSISGGGYVIEAFDLTNFTLLGSTSVTNISGTPSRIIRWGNNGLAFLTGNASGAGVYLLSGGFVTSPAP